MPYAKEYGISGDTGFENITQLLQDEPLHPMSFHFNAASGKNEVVFHPAGLGYPDATTPSRTKTGVGDDTAPVAGTAGTQLLQYGQSRIFVIFETVANAVVTDGGADVTIWHRGRPGVEDASAALAGQWVRGNTFADVTNYQELLDTQLYHREVYIQLTNLVGTALHHVDIYVAGIEDVIPHQPFNFSSSGALLVEIKDVHVEVGNIEVQLEASPDQVGEKADSVLVSSTLDHTNIVAGNYQPPVAPLYIDDVGRVGVVGSVGDHGVTDSSGPVKIDGRDYLGTQSVLTTALAGADNDLTFTAKTPGVAGDAITVSYVDGGAVATSIVVAGTAITVTGDITGAGVTAAEVMAAVNGSYEALALVSVENATGDDGTGNIIALVATNLAGGADGDHVNTVAVNADGAAFVAAEASAGTPAAVAAGATTGLTVTLDRALRVVSTRGFDPTTHRVAVKPIPPTGGQRGITANSATIGNVTRLTAADTPCRKVWYRVDPNWVANDIIAIGFDSTNGNMITAAGILQTGMALSRAEAWREIETDNASKLYIAADAASVRVLWMADNNPAT